MQALIFGNLALKLVYLDELLLLESTISCQVFTDVGHVSLGSFIQSLQLVQVPSLTHNQGTLLLHLSTSLSECLFVFGFVTFDSSTDIGLLCLFELYLCFLHFNDALDFLQLRVELFLFFLQGQDCRDGLLHGLLAGLSQLTDDLFAGF